MPELITATSAEELEQETALLVGIDDGYACTKVALDDRLISVPSSGRIGYAKVSWLPKAQQMIFEYQTGGTVYSIGEVDAESTRYDGYAASALNRAIVQHALQCADLEGKNIIAVSGMPVSAFYGKSGARRVGDIEGKRENLLVPVTPLGGASSADVVEHQVIPEALAAWYDHVVLPDGDGGASLDYLHAVAPIAVVDIGGRTIDTVVVRDRGIIHASSGSYTLGILDAIESFTDAIEERFDVSLPDRSMVAHAFETGSIPIYGRMYDVSNEVDRAKRELTERLHAHVRRQLGSGAELHQVLMVGGGALALRDHIDRWFPNQVTAKQPAFANARGMLKYLRYVCNDAESTK